MRIILFGILVVAAAVFIWQFYGKSATSNPDTNPTDRPGALPPTGPDTGPTDRPGASTPTGTTYPDGTPIQPEGVPVGV